MGGNLFSTRRIDRETYNRTVGAIMAEVSGGHLPLVRVRDEVAGAKYIFASMDRFTGMAVVPSCSDKADYGDIDFIVENDAGTVISALEERLPGVDFHVNDGCVSVPWPLDDDSFVQVDFICRPHNFEDALAYRSYAPFGHICGAIFDENGYSFGEKGLFRKVTGKRSGSKEFHVCNVDEGYKLLGLSIEDMESRGAVTEESMFFYLSNCFYLRWARFRRRDDREMGSMNRFAEFLDRQPAVKEHGNLPLVMVTEAHGNGWLLAANAFERKDELLKKFREHVNGETVSKITGLPKGEALGAMMKKINSLVGPLIEQAAEKDLDPLAVLAVAYANDTFVVPDENHE